MAALPIYETQKGFNAHALPYTVLMADFAILTDAIINPLTTVAGLRAVTFSGYETSRRWYEQWQRHVDFLQAIGVLTDARVAAMDTVAGLELLMTQEDANLVIGKGSFVA
jgi:hypothetical protein